MLLKVKVLYSRRKNNGRLKCEAVIVKVVATFVSSLKNLDSYLCAASRIARDITDLKRLQVEISDKVVQLEDALSKVKQLEGIIPICSWCKKIRDDGKSWHQLEHYISSHSEAKFSHGVCPECYELQMREIENL